MPPRGHPQGYTAVKPVTLAQDGTAVVAGPQMVTQLMNEHPLLPLDDLNRAFRRDRSFLQGRWDLKKQDKILEYSATSARVWKTSVFLRGAYGVRNAFDEGPGGLAALASWMYWAGAIPGVYRVAKNVPGHVRNKALGLGRDAKNRRAVRMRQLPEHERIARKHERGMEDIEIMPGVRVSGVLNDGTGVTRMRVGSDQRGCSTSRTTFTWRSARAPSGA